MRNILLGIFVALFFGIALLGSAKATEYDPSNPWYLSAIGADPAASSIACSPELEHCAVLVYNDYPVLGKKLQGFFISDPRSSWGTYTVPDFEIGIDYTGYDTYQPFMPYPFGIQYNRNNGFYYFWYYAGSGTGARVYVYYPMNGTAVNVATVYGGCYVTGCAGIIGQGTQNTGNLYYTQCIGAGFPYFNLRRYNMFTRTDTIVGNGGSVGCSWDSSTCYDVTFHKAYIGEKSDGRFQIYEFVRWRDTGGLHTTHNDVCAWNMSGFPAGWTGLQYELNDDIYYAINATANVTWGIYKVHSSDFSTYSGNGLYYTFNSGIDEYIPRSIGAKSDIGAMYQQYRECSSTYGGYACPQIDVSNLIYHTIRIQSIYDDPLTRYTIENTPISILATATCNSLNYTVSGSGSVITLGLPCISNITLQFVNTQYKPATFTEQFNFPSGCEDSGMFIKLTYSKAYNIPITVSDELTGLPIQGATVILDALSNSTDINGMTMINIYPVDSPTFLMATNNITCQQASSITGTLHPYYYSVEKTDYSSDIETPLYLATSFGGAFIFTPSKTTTLVPSGFQVFVRMKSIDGIEVSPVTSETTILGTGTGDRVYLLSDSGYLNLSEQFSSTFRQGYVDGLPKEFIIFTNQTSLNITVSSIYSGQTYNVSQTLVNGTNTYTVWIQLNSSWKSMPCDSNLDCLGGGCSGNVFNQLYGCNDNKCSYTTEICRYYCDDLMGCYQYSSSTPCSTDYDCPKTCENPTTARTGLCGSDGFCKFKTNSCTSAQGCINTTIGNQTIGICSEAQACYLTGASKQLYQIRKEFFACPTIGGIPITFCPAQTKIYLDVNSFFCTATSTSSNKRTCIKGAVVPITEAGSQTADNYMATTPDTWQYTTSADGLYYRFYDISVACDENCQSVNTYCQYGCNEETGYCLNAPLTGGGPTKIVTDQLAQFFNTIAPDLYSKAMYWTFFMFIIMGLLVFISRHWEIGAISGLAWALVGVVVGWYPIWVGIVFVVLAGIFIASMVTKRYQFGG